jgi:thiol-disulfide isomerase/thioredoxin
MKNKIVILLLIAGILAIISAGAYAETPLIAEDIFSKNNTRDSIIYPAGNCDGEIHALYFYEDGCPDCEKIKPFIEEVESKHSNLNITKINARDELELCLRCAMRYNVSAQVPMIIIGEYALVGRVEIENKFESIIKKYIDEKRECITLPNPDLTDTNVLPKVCLLLFMSPVCSECHTAEAYINKLEKKYLQLEVKKLNLNERENFELMEKFNDGYGITAGTLEVFVGDKYFTNAESIKEELEPLILENLDSGLNCPQTMGKDENYPVPVFGSFEISTIIFAGLIDGINPCAITIFVFFVSFLFLVGRKGKNILFVGIAFISAVFITYLLIGLGLFEFIIGVQNKIEILSKIIYPSIVILTLISAGLALKDALNVFLGKAFELKFQTPKNIKQITHKITGKQISMKFIVALAFVAGIILSLFEFLCTGQVYLPTIIYIIGIPELKTKAIFYLAVYTLFFIMPLIIIFLKAYIIFCIAYFIKKSRKTSAFFEKHALILKILTAILFLVISIVMFFASFFIAILSTRMFGIL